MQIYNPTISQRIFTRNFLRVETRRVSFVVATILACLSFFPATSHAIQSSKPNIVLINLDDADADILSTENIEAHYPTLAALGPVHRSVCFQQWL